MLRRVRFRRPGSDDWPWAGRFRRLGSDDEPEAQTVSLNCDITPDVRGRP